VWPFLLSIVGLGVAAKDGNVTNASKPSAPSNV
jgi:hypothetical protein